MSLKIGCEVFKFYAPFVGKTLSRIKILLSISELMKSRQLIHNYENLY